MRMKKTCLAWCVVLIVVAAAAVAQDRPGPTVPRQESDLIAVLQSNAPKAEKAFACKDLAIYGSEQAVPALAALLGDPELASWTRIALEAIPGAAADAALRDALDQLQGRLLVGAINSLGVRRDKRAVKALALKLEHSNASVASAAAVALGHIGGPQAGQALSQSLGAAPAGVRSAVAEGCILCAEGYLAQDQAAEAIKLYDAVRQAAVPEQRHLEAIRGAILARHSAGVPLLVEQLRSENVERLGIGLRTARELPGRDVTEALAAELARLDPDRRPLLLLALADRKDAAVLPIVVKAAQGRPAGLRVTAITILIRLGDVSSVPVLLEAATEDNAQLEAAAKETLIRLPGRDVDAELLGRLVRARGKLRRVLIELAGQRQIGEALPAVASSLHDTDTAIRFAAVETVGIIGQDPQCADLVGLLQGARRSQDRTRIEKSLLAISGRCGTKCISYLRPLTQSRNGELHMIGLHALAIIGGPEALRAVTSAIKSAESDVQDEAVRILSTWPNNWPDDRAAGQALLALAKSDGKLAHQVLGLRGYLRYVGGTKTLNNEQKVANIKDVLPLLKRPEERRQAIAVLGGAPSVTALTQLTSFAQDPAVAEEAYLAMVRIAGQNTRAISKERRRETLKTVIEQSKNNGTKQRARKTLNGIR